MACETVCESGYIYTQYIYPIFRTFAPRHATRECVSENDEQLSRLFNIEQLKRKRKNEMPLRHLYQDICAIGHRPPLTAIDAK